MTHLIAMSDKLIFVYNADSGIFNAFKDLIHKNLSPETYPCSLCTVTYNNLGMRREWKQFIQQLGRSVEFLHRDELEKKYGIKGIPLPAAFTKCMGEEPRIWLNAEKMNSCKSLGDLKQLVMSNLN
ncbi:MAG: hypothetical protein L0287_30535 [Anaerolineae bacterium]|nr:hypothetical protein [Anaerolineae bacterium]MCI0609702.1 hypothetical protein [Anaerolineae bacterium]